jgi:hypothetical protein
MMPFARPLRGHTATAAIHITGNHFIDIFILVALWRLNSLGRHLFGPSDSVVDPIVPIKVP